MKILEFTPYFVPYIGGQEKYVENLCKYLVRSGHVVTVITSNIPKGNKYEVNNGIKIFRYFCLGTILRNPITPGFIFLKSKIESHDIVHIHNEHSTSAFLAAVYRLHTNVPLVVTCHGQLKFGDSIKNFIEKIYSRLFGKMIFKISDLIIALSESDKKYIISLGIPSKKIKVMPNAIDIYQYQSGQIKDIEFHNFKNKYNLSDKKIVLFVGQIIKRKGIEYLLKAIPIILKNYSNNAILFVFIGNGVMLIDAKKLCCSLGIENHVLFLSNVNNKDLKKFYLISDIFVLPSLSEGLPTVILEAMYFGVPVIASDIPGINDYFSDTAILVPPRDEQEIAYSILSILTDKKDVKELSRKGREFIDSKFSWDKIAQEYECLFKDLRESFRY